MVLLAGMLLLFPDTATSVGLRFGPIRISPLGVLLFLTAPPVVGWVWSRYQLLSLRL